MFSTLLAYVAGGLAIAVAGLGWYSSSLKADLVEAERNQAKLELNLEIVKDGLSSCNASVASWEETSRITLAKTKELVEEAKKEREAKEKVITKVLTVKPTPGKTSCQDAEALMDKYFKGELR